MLGDSELISLRSREVTDRPLLSDADGVRNQVRMTWKLINMLLPTILIILLGVYIIRRDKQKAIQIEAMYE